MLFGHQDKIKLFKKLAKENKLNHAYLFFGDARVGKFTFAQHLAYFLEYGELGILEKPLIDSYFFSPNEKNVIGIDETKSIKNFLYQKPINSSKRMAIIEKAECLTDEAQSSLLKIVEEPPESSLIIFIASNAQILFAPLLSRLVKIYFKRFADEEIKNILIEHHKLSVAQASLLAKNSFGKIGRALTAINGENEVLENDIEKIIVAKYTENPLKNSKILSWLLEKESDMARFNLNKNLQNKTINYKISERL